MLEREAMIALLESELEQSPAEIRWLYVRRRVSLERRPFAKATTLESAWLVARRGAEAIYYEEVEEGFNTSEISADGQLLDHWFDQDPLQVPLRKWLQDDDGDSTIDPSVQVFYRLLSDWEPVLKASPDLCRRFRLACMEHLATPPVAEPWLKVARDFASKRATERDLTEACVQAWQFLGKRSCEFWSPAINRIRAVICLLYPNRDPSDRFDELLAFGEFFRDTGGPADVLIEELRRAFRS